jgi:hypothetical protein
MSRCIVWSGPDLEHQIEMALLNDLETPLKMVYVGGDESKQFDGRYGGVWIAETANVEDDIFRFWGLPTC